MVDVQKGLLRKLGLLCGFLLLSANVAAQAPLKGPLKDLFYGESLFYAYQNRFFEAIVRLDTELAQFYHQDDLSLDPLHYHRNEAEFNVGDLEISYRMHQRAGRALRAIMEGKVDEKIRNEAAFRLARIYFQKNQPVNALHVIERIRGKVPESIQHEEALLRAQIYLFTGRFKEAVKLLKDLQGVKSIKGFVDYNLGIAMIQNGQKEKGLKQLDKMGQMGGSNDAVMALKDKANLALGYEWAKHGQHQRAKRFFDRVRLDGPFSNKALLGAGWMDAFQGRYKRALVPWSELHKRRTVDSDVQEAMLAVPYAYGQLDVYGKAALMYGHAMDVFGTEVARLDASIKSIREGKFLKAVIREESKKDKFWLLNLRKLPDTPETRYIMDLMASHDFQESIKNYHDLAELRDVITSALPSLDVYEELIAIRRSYYEPLLPKIEAQFRKVDTRINLRIGQRDRLNKRIQSMLIARRPEYLATAFEHRASEQLQAMAESAKDEAIKARIKRLQGVILWQIESQYDDRLTKAYKHARELDAVIAKLKEQYRSFIRTRQAATQSYEGYAIPIRRLRTKLQASLRRIKAVMARQGLVLETLAINELDRRRKKLEEYQVKARFALAESYDRATKARQEKLKEQEAEAAGKKANKQPTEQDPVQK